MASCVFGPSCSEFLPSGSAWEMCNQWQHSKVWNETIILPFTQDALWCPCDHCSSAPPPQPKVTQTSGSLSPRLHCKKIKINDAPFIDLHDFRLYPSIISMPNDMFVEHYWTAVTALAFQTHEKEGNGCVTIKHTVQTGSHLLCGIYTSYNSQVHTQHKKWLILRFYIYKKLIHISNSSPTVWAWYECKPHLNIKHNQELNSP